jgi:hypothetical protein
MTIQKQKLEVVRLADLPAPKPIDTSEALPAEELSWELLLAEEPEILEILDLLQSFPNRYPYERWHVFVKKTGTSPKAYLTKLVGFSARNPRLRSMEAYEMVIRRMWELVD